MRIGIFDSGSGGSFVADKLRSLLPAHEYIVIDDRANAPYGDKTYDEIERLTKRAILPLLNCDCIVLACNTATVAAVESLRQTYPEKTFIGFEPMIKPAAVQSKNQHITLLATRATAYSPRTAWLIETYASNTTVDRPNTTDWAYLIDHSKTTTIDLHEVSQSIASGSDAIIIGCTHYIALLPVLRTIFPGITIYEPTEAVARRLESIINSAPLR